MRIDVLAPTAVSIAETVEFARRAEAAGAHGVGFPDHLEHGRDGFVALALAAKATSTLDLYPAVANVLTRHPFQIAALARSMQEIAGPRFKLVVGAGGSTAERTGQPPASRSRLRETIATLKALLRGDAATFGVGDPQRIDDPAPPGPPVHLVASGPKAIRLAGEVADGALLFVGISRPIRDAGTALLAEGLAARETERSFETTFNTLISVDDDPSVARERTRNAAFNWLRLKRFDLGLERIGAAYATPRSSSALSGDLLSAICDHFFITGTPSDCAAKLTALAKEGVGRVLLMPAGGAQGAERTFHLVEQMAPKA